MENKDHGMLQLAIISVVALVSLLIGVVTYYDSLLGSLQETTCQTLNEVILQEKNNFAQKLITDQETLKGFATLLTASVSDEQSLIQTLAIIAQNTDFEYVSYATPGGVSYNNEGKTANVFDRNYFHAALAGETVVSEPIQSKLREAYVIVIATPVTHEGNIIGVLSGSFEIDKLNKLFMSSFNGYGYTYIANNEGELIVKTESNYALAKTKNLFDLYKTADFYSYDSYETIIQNLIEGKDGHSQYKIDGQYRFMHYAKLPINDWNIFVAVSPEGVEKIAGKILIDAIVLIAGLGAIFISLLLYNLISHKRFTRELTNMAYVDDVTGHRSFGKFKIDAKELIVNNTNINYMLIKMDIEKFKLINEIHSMELGDQILRAEAIALEAALDERTDAFGRIHADEFVLLLGYKTDEERLAKKQHFEDYFMYLCSQLVNFKIVLPQGRYKLQKGETEFAPLYEKVNFAHKLAKISDSRELDFDGKVQELAIREQEIESKMEGALLAGEFHMYLQPKYSLTDEIIVGAEALVRWIVHNKPIVYPDEFIPLFEQNGFIKKIDMYMFENACKTIRGWIDSGIDPIIVSVNFSRLHLGNPNFIEELSAIADRYQLPYYLLEIELTETTMFDNIDVLEDVLNRIHKAGFTLSMDDFGSGYSSLALLKNIPVDVIKIDKGFFDQSKDQERAKTVICSVMEMAKRLNIHTVAEGVETIEHIRLLRELGCETVQGYYYAKPMPAAELEIKLLRNLFSAK